MGRAVCGRGGVGGRGRGSVTGPEWVGMGVQGRGGLVGGMGLGWTRRAGKMEWGG